MKVPLSQVTYTQIVDAYPDKPFELLQRFGTDVYGKPLVCDGKPGTKSRAALYLNPAIFMLAEEIAANARDDMSPHQVGLFVKASLGHYVHPSAIAAFKDVWNGEGETLGNNRGPFVSMLYEDDNPTAQQGAWCGVCLRYWIRKAYPDSLPNVRKSWLAKGVSSQLKKIAPANCQSGDALIYNRKVDGSYNNINGHATLIALRDGDLVFTFEGNVDIKPGVDGCAARRYSLGNGLVSHTGAPFHQIGRVA